MYKTLSVIILLSKTLLTLSQPPYDDNRVIHGFNCSRQDFPFMVSIYSPEWPIGWDRMCAGSLLGASWVLTAAHCLTDSKYFGVMYQVKYNADKVIKAMPFKHMNFKRKHEINDIGLLRLTKTIPKSKHVWYVKLPTQESRNYDLPCDKGLIMGLGRTDYQVMANLSENNLQCAYVPMMPIETCAKYYPHRLYPGMMCSYSPGGEAACKGDSGGPLMCGDVQVGVISWGSGCGKKPDVFTKVAYYLKWMKLTATMQRDDDDTIDRIFDRSVRVHRQGIFFICLLCFVLVLN